MDQSLTVSLSFGVAVILGLSTGGNGDMTVSGTGHVKVTGEFSQNALVGNGGTVEVIPCPPPAGEDPVLNNAMVGGYLRGGALVVSGGVDSSYIIKVGVTAGKTGTLTAAQRQTFRDITAALV